MAENHGSVYEVIDEWKRDIDKDCADRHERHNKLFAGVGERIGQMEGKIEALERGHALQSAEVSNLERRKVEVTNIRFTPSMVLALLGLFASVFGSQKLATWGIADQQEKTNQAIDLMSVKMDAMKQHEEDVIRLQDERAANVQRQITQISGQATMIDTKLSNLRETAALTARGR